ncbi:MAG: hypothetical protein JWP25_7092 [Bradyrhizobium sp.]|jgi:hypothetical protein|nr:hypothetical protein [Bradyrhizobium sp.]
MFPRSIYLRDQADKCRSHASHLGDGETQQELRKLADEYVARAVEIESQEQGLGSVGARQKIADRHPGTIGPH